MVDLAVPFSPSIAPFVTARESSLRRLLALQVRDQFLRLRTAMIFRRHCHGGQRRKGMESGCRRQFGDGQDLRPGPRQLDADLQV